MAKGRKVQGGRILSQGTVYFAGLTLLLYPINLTDALSKHTFWYGCISLFHSFLKLLFLLKNTPGLHNYLDYFPFICHSVASLIRQYWFCFLIQLFVSCSVSMFVIKLTNCTCFLRLRYKRTKEERPTPPLVPCHDIPGPHIEMSFVKKLSGESIKDRWRIQLQTGPFVTTLGSSWEMVWPHYHNTVYIIASDMRFTSNCCRRWVWYCL